MPEILYTKTQKEDRKSKLSQVKNTILTSTKYLLDIYNNPLNGHNRNVSTNMSSSV